MADVRSDDAGRGPEIFGHDTGVAAGGPHSRDALPEDARQRLPCRGRHGRAGRRKRSGRARHRRRKLSGRSEARSYAQEPYFDEELRRRPLGSWKGAEGGRRGAGQFPAVHAARPDRRNREGAGRRDHARRRHGCREGARHLRVDRREHLPQPENAGLRPRRRPVPAGLRGPGRQVRRFERPLRRTRARGGPSGARRVRNPRGRLGSGVQEPWNLVGERLQGAALPGRGVPRRIRLGSRRSRGRAQSRSRGAAGKSAASTTTW